MDGLSLPSSRPFAPWRFAVLFVVAVGVPLYFFICPCGDWQSFYEGFVGEEYRRSLGFSTGPYSTSEGRVWAITGVTPGGVFDRAGVRVGDTPIQLARPEAPLDPHPSGIWHHGYPLAAGLFYRFLHSNAGRGAVAFAVNGCSGQGHHFKCACSPRKIVIEVPPPDSR